MEFKRNNINETHNQIITWIENCDTKASIILAFISVIASILFTNDYLIKTVENKLLSPVINYWLKGIGSFYFIIFIVWCLWIISTLFISYSVILLIKTLKANTKSNGSSILYWGSISNMKAEDYISKVQQISDNDIEIDKLKQIHICAQICSKKFTNYNKALCNLKIGLLLFVLFILSILIINSFK